jgi:hypothetical protein
LLSLALNQNGDDMKSKVVATHGGRASDKMLPMPKKPRYQKTSVDLASGAKITLYVGSKVHSALQEVTAEMDLYKGVRLGEVMEAVYEQGLKDGRKEIIESFQGLAALVNYLPPGRPRSKKKR